jgi:hypothetical protein
MASQECERAVEDAFKHGTALLKYIQANEVGLTGGHQAGFYIPVDDKVWPLFTPQKPFKGLTHTHPVEVTWPDGTVTASNIKWYGDKSRREYRLTAFNKIRHFPYRSEHLVGAMLILIPVVEQKKFIAHVLDMPEDVEEFLASVGVSIAKYWALFVQGEETETEDDCIERGFIDFARPLKEDFPTGDQFSAATWKILEDCIRNFGELSADDALVKCMDTEYSLFKRVERKICEAALVRSFDDVDDFIDAAQTLLQRRKSRAGRSLENHVSYFLKRAGIPHDMRPKIGGKPDVVIPSKKDYENKNYPADKLFLVACKTTFKDRWAQVIKEGKRVGEKHLFTLQKGIAKTQLEEMREANVTVVVPDTYHAGYPKSPNVLSVAQFFDRIKTALGA